VYTRKAQFQYGWDWGPKLNTSGIWKNISINAWDGARFENIFIKQEEISTTKARLAIEILIESTSNKSASLFTKINREVIATNIALKKGKHTYKVPVEITNFKLWWTQLRETLFVYF
jgi:beta-mannosidase